MDIERIKRENLARAMRRRGWSNRELAEKIEREVSFVSMLLHGHRNIGFRTMRLLESTGISEREIYDQPGEKTLATMPEGDIMRFCQSAKDDKKFQVLVLAYQIYSVKAKDQGQRAIQKLLDGLFAALGCYIDSEHGRHNQSHAESTAPAVKKKAAENTHHPGHKA